MANQQRPPDQPEPKPELHPADVLSDQEKIQVGAALQMLKETPGWPLLWELVERTHARVTQEFRQVANLHELGLVQGRLSGIELVFHQLDGLIQVGQELQGRDEDDEDRGRVLPYARRGRGTVAGE